MDLCVNAQGSFTIIGAALSLMYSFEGYHGCGQKLKMIRNSINVINAKACSTEMAYTR